MTERTPPDSPHVRSGVSSFSHISSPQSYQFSRDGDASDEEGSSWSSDEVCTSVSPFCLHLISMLSATLSRLYLVGRRDGSKVCGDVDYLVEVPWGCLEEVYWIKLVRSKAPG